MNKQIITVVFVISFLITAVVKADYTTSLVSGQKNDTQLGFEVWDGDKHFANGTIISSDGNGNNKDHSGTIFGDKKANYWLHVQNTKNLLMSFDYIGDDFFTSFVLVLGTDSAPYDIMVTATITNGTLTEEVVLNQNTPTGNKNFIVNEFKFSLTDQQLEDGFYYKSFEIAVSDKKGGNTNGIYIGGFGDKDSKFGSSSSSTVTPEPATLLILGIGAAGAGLAARRRVKK